MKQIKCLCGRSWYVVRLPKPDDDQVLISKNSNVWRRWTVVVLGCDRNGVEHLAVCDGCR